MLEQHGSPRVPERALAGLDPSTENSALHLSIEEQWHLIYAARDAKPVVGLTHNYYRYPARFPPQMVRAVIEAFSQPGDLVLDPFAGGGTTLVEALAQGRSAFGSDVSTLAEFVSTVKTTLLDDAVLDDAAAWANTAVEAIRMDKPEPAFPTWATAGYFKHLGHKRFWRIRKALAQAIATVDVCASVEAERFARCIVLRTAQWALDGRRLVPSIDGFRKALLLTCREMTLGMHKLKVEAGRHDEASVEYRSRSAVGLENDPAFASRLANLVMTSPPYPGVHVLYHRWQVGGGKETGAPFWIANTLDGSGGSHYTMGDRKAAGLDQYFDTIEASLKSVSAVCAADAVVVQVVAFAQPEWQLPRYLEACARAGLAEFRLPVLALEGDGRLWRKVPNRRWHAHQKGATSSSNEVMLFHQRG